MRDTNQPELWPLPPETLAQLFLEPTTHLLEVVRSSLETYVIKEQDADVCVYETMGRERWIVNVRAKAMTALPELHRDWHDLSLYLLGRNDMTVGGTLSGARETSVGEWREGTLTGGDMLTILPNQVLWVPAGKPHQSNFHQGTAFVIVKILAGTETSSPLLGKIPNLSAPYTYSIR